MNSVPLTIEPTWDILPKVFILIGFIVVLTIVISGRRLPEIARALAKFLVVGVLLLVIAGFFWTRGVPIQTATRLETQHASSLPSAPPIESSALESPSSPVVGELESAKSEIGRPEWTRQPVRVDGRRKVIVVSSGRFASEQEAELHGFQQAAVVAVKDYSSLDPRGIGDVQPQHADVIKDYAISNRFMESVSFDFGKFQAPMHQLWLEVALTPELGERLAEPWRQAAVESRLRTLGGWGVWGTAAAALAAFGLRLDSAWNGRRRLIVAGTTIALALGGLAFVS